jgi:tryptophanyl-tRNA synthetase
MDLQEPTKKMSKSNEGQGGVGLLEAPEAIARKFKRAVTDSDGEVRYDRQNKPGVSNLLEILGVLTNRPPEQVAESYTQYGPLKTDAGEAVIEMTRPFRERVEEFSRDPATIAALLAKGADKARQVASVTVARAYRNIGLLSPG